MNTREALQVVLDQVDYTAGNCCVNEMVGAVLSRGVISLARKAIEEDKGAGMIEAVLHLDRVVLGNESSGVRAKILRLWVQTLRSSVRVDVYPEAQHVDDVIEWLESVAWALVGG